MADTPARTDPGNRPAPSNGNPGKRKRQKISRWDRPPEPHDWRWVVGHIGRALITVGMLMFGFVAYQLWGTGIQTARAQDSLKNEFKNELQDKGITQDTLAPPTSTTVASTVATTGTVTPGSDGTATDPVASSTIGDATTTTTSIAPVHQIYGNIKPGDALGEIIIPKIDLDFYIVAGVSKANLDDGVGHFPNTPLPGQLGNVALAGHRTSHLAPFYDLDHLQPGDEVQFKTAIGGAYVYIVTDSEVVSPSDYHVVTDSDPTKATLTLITCTPIGTSSHRLVVHATIDASRGSAIGESSTYYGETDTSTFNTTDPSLPSDDTLPSDGSAAPDTLPADGTATATVPGSVATDATTTVPAGTVATTSVSTTVAAAGGVTTTSVNPVDEFSDDAFQAGWFDDSSAFPQVAIWAVLFGLIWYGCYRLARWRRNAWIGIATSIIPVVVVLYFLYENVNRLLPAAI
ncbi:MAG: peptidase family protein [Ilumatobacteraceae bacterium]|nr:peptidase family protein [Ilumatobacteraceae bacterium]